MPTKSLSKAGVNPTTPTTSGLVGKSGHGPHSETVGKKIQGNSQGRQQEFGFEMVLNHLAQAERSLQLLKETIDRRMYDEVIDNAVHSLELRLFMFRSDTERQQKEKHIGTTD